jgi:hypothetical protein
MIRSSSLLCAAALITSSVSAQNVVVGQSDAPWEGFMNVLNLDGGFVFGSGWGVQDLVANFNDPARTLTMSPNTIGDPNEFWYQDPTGGGNTNPGGPGAPGNKIMEANLFQTVSNGPLSGVNVVFSGVVLSNSFTQAHEARIFIRDFVPNFSSFTESSIPATPGAFSVSLMTDSAPGRHVQYGFQVKGVNVWVTDTAPFGNVVIQTIPTPASMAVLGACGLIAQRRRRAM